MELSLFLAKLFGIYFTIIGVAVIIKRDALIKAMKVFVRDIATGYFIAAVELIAGIILVLNHNVWDGSWRVVVTIISWWILVEGALYLLLPQKTMTRLIAMFSTRGWLATSGVVALAVGLYLLVQGGLVV